MRSAKQTFLEFWGEETTLGKDFLRFIFETYKIGDVMEMYADQFRPLPDRTTEERTQEEIHLRSLNSPQCLKCGLSRTPEGHDGCVGELDSSLVMNACCGHGRTTAAYVQFWKDPDSAIRGQEALGYIKSNKSNH